MAAEAKPRARDRCDPTVIQHAFVSAPDLMELLADGQGKGSGPLLIAVGQGSEEKDSARYIRSAMYLDTCEIEDWKADDVPNSTCNLLNLDDLTRNLCLCGISQASWVVLYSSPCGMNPSPDPTSAARVGWALLQVGLTKVQLLDGGIAAWEACGFGTEAHSAERQPVDFFAPVGPLPAKTAGFLATTEKVEQVVSGEIGGCVLADVRSWDEFIGKLATRSFAAWRA